DPPGSLCANGAACRTDCTCSLCPPGETLCSGVCVNESSDPNNCGGCGVVCTTGRVCTSGTCSSHLAFPQMPGHGQPPLSQLQLVTVTFAGYPFRDFVESFGDFV